MMVSTSWYKWLAATGWHRLVSRPDRRQSTGTSRETSADSDRTILCYSIYIPSLSLPPSPSLTPAWLAADKTWRTSKAPNMQMMHACVFRLCDLSSPCSLVPCRPADVLLPWSNHGAGRTADVQGSCDSSICIDAFSGVVEQERLSGRGEEPDLEAWLGQRWAPGPAPLLENIHPHLFLLGKSWGKLEPHVHKAFYSN